MTTTGIKLKHVAWMKNGGHVVKWVDDYNLEGHTQTLGENDHLLFIITHAHVRMDNRGSHTWEGGC